MTIKHRERLYLDSNFLVAFFIANHQDHISSKKLFFELIKEEAEMFISFLTLDETWFKAFETLQNQIPKYKRKPIKEFYQDLKKILESILQNPLLRIIQFENNLIQGVKNALENIGRYNLKPRDAFHYSLMEDSEIISILTKNKKDFERIPHIKIYSF